MGGTATSEAARSSLYGLQRDIGEGAMMGRQLMPLLHGVGRGSGRGETVGAGVRGYREGREGAAPLRSYGLQPRASAPRRARHGSARATDRRGRHGDRQLVKRDGLSRGQGARSTAIGGRLRRADAHARATAQWSANAHGHARSSSPGCACGRPAGGHGIFRVSRTRATSR